MRRTLSCLTLIFCILTIISPKQALANQNDNLHTPTTFFSIFENYLIAYNIIDLYNKQVLAAHTKAQNNQPTPTPSTTPQSYTDQRLTNPPTDVSVYILHGVNDYRASLGLSPVQSSIQTCAFATIRAKEITNGFNHDGFYNRVNSHTIPYSSWTRAVENIAETPDYKNVVTLWKNSPGHAANMRDNTPFVCIAQNGNYYAYEGMKP